MQEWSPEWLVSKFQDAEDNHKLFADIDGVPWDQLNHAYGAASDVPALLRALLSDEPDYREFALELLFGNIWHQGTVYPATRYATPFLMRILNFEEAAMQVRISMLHLLQCIANGHSYVDVHYPQPESFYKIYAKAEVNYEAELAKELEDVRLARESVLMQKDLLLALLNHENPELVCNCFVLLGGFAEYSVELFSNFVERYRQTPQNEIKGAILEAIRTLRITAAAKVDFLKQVLATELDIELRAIAALGLVEAQKQSYDPHAMHTLLEFVTYRVTNEEQIENMASWKFLRGETTSIRAAASALIELSSPSRLSEFLNFISLLQSPSDVFEFVQDLIFRLYPPVSRDKIYQLLSTDNGKHQVKYCRSGPVEITITKPMDPVEPEFVPILKLILDLPLFWEVESNMLNVFGLPHAKEEIAQLVRNMPTNTDRQ